MNPKATKILAGLVLFASGVVVGLFGSRFLAERGRLALLHGDPRHFSDMILRRLSDDLELSPEQREKLRPIVLQTAERMHEIRQEQEPKVREAIDKSIRDIKALLTPEQAEKFTAVMERLEKRRKAMERFGPPPPPPGMGGFPPPGGPHGPPPPPPDLEGFPPPPGMGLPPDFDDFPPPPGMGPPPGHDRPWPPRRPDRDSLPPGGPPDLSRPSEPRAPDGDRPSVPEKTSPGPESGPGPDKKG